jgi:hypothetical protein
VENKRLQNDNDDLQHEFERERQEYLNTIREQEKRILLYQAMISKMSQVMQRNCNYSNLDKIMKQARYDEEKNQYILPEPTLEDTQFPQVANLPTATNGRTHTQQNDYITAVSKPISTSPVNEYEYDFVEPTHTNNGYHNQIAGMNNEELEKRYGRNPDSSNLPTERTRHKRQEQLLNENLVLQRAKRPLQNINTDNDYMNRRLNPYDAPARLSRKYGFSSDK